MLDSIFYLKVSVAMFKYDIEMASYSGTSSSTTRKCRRIWEPVQVRHESAVVSGNKFKYDTGTPSYLGASSSTTPKHRRIREKVQVRHQSSVVLDISFNIKKRNMPMHIPLSLLFKYNFLNHMHFFSIY